MASSSDEQPKPPEPPAAAVAAAAQSHAEWAASLQAYYAAAGHPYAWPAQHLMAAAALGAPYGTPVPFPVYHPGAAMAYYAHASMAAGVTYPTAEAVAAVAAAAVKGKGKGGGASPEKGSSGAPSGDDASRSGDSGSEESSETRDDDTDHKDSSAPKKRKSGNTSAEGVPSQTAVVPCAAVESPYQVKGRSASKLPVSAPGRAVLPNATPNLNIGIDLWSASPALDVPAGQGEANPGLALARRDGVAQLDERELKRERRKQSNRESARRSRLRKQCSSLLPCEVCYPCVAPVSFKWSQCCCNYLAESLWFHIGCTPINQQIRKLDYGVDVVIGTPGCVIDLLKRGALNLSEVRFVVLDEADQMLSVGFDEDVETILDRVPPQRQTLMFSATMPSWIRKLTQKYLKDPVTIDLVGEDDQKLAEGISLYSIVSENYSKPAVLGQLIQMLPPR